MKLSEVLPKIECEEVYEAAQDYRHAPISDQELVTKRYEELKEVMVKRVWTILTFGDCEDFQ